MLPRADDSVRSGWLRSGRGTRTGRSAAAADPGARRRRRLGDAVAVAVANGFAIAAELETGSKDPDALAYLLGVAIAVPLLVRRRWPLGVLLASAVLLTAYHALDYPAIGLAVPLGVALFTAVAAGHLREAAIVSLGLALLGIGVRALEEGESLVSVAGSGTVDDVALLVAVMALADVVISRLVGCSARRVVRSVAVEALERIGRRALSFDLDRRIFGSWSAYRLRLDGAGCGTGRNPQRAAAAAALVRGE